MFDDAKLDAEFRRAKKFFRQKKFLKVVRALEKNNSAFARECSRLDGENFAFATEWLYTLGVSCMYLGDISSAADYLVKARRISRENDILVNEVLLAQAAIFLRRGNTAKAIELYLDILATDPANKVARRAMKFLKGCDDEAVFRLVSNGKIKKFYPNAGFYFPVAPAVCAVVFVVFAALIAFRVAAALPSEKGSRADLSALGISLSKAEKSAMLESDVSVRAFNYILSESEVERIFLLAQDDFQRYRDNSARVKINKILNSNATSAVHRKASLLASQLQTPDFESLRGSDENFSAQKVCEEPTLFDGCFVVWKGRAANVSPTDSGISCVFLAGYEDLKSIDARVPLRVQSAISFDASRSFEVFAKIHAENGEFFLEAASIFQPRDFK